MGDFIFKDGAKGIGSELEKQVQNPEFQIREKAIDFAQNKAFPFRQQELPEPVGYSALGTPVFDNVKIEAGSYEFDGQTIEYDELVVDTVLLDVGQTKNIVKTAVQGRPGTVKRYASKGDYYITIRGQIVNNENNLKYPEEEVLNLIKVLESNESLDIVSKFLQALDIFEVVVTGYRLPQTTSQNSQPFEIRCLSDEPFEFIISDNG